MKVLLKEDVSNLGYAGEVMEVANGYGRNYLIPQGMAVKATAGELASAKAWRERAKIRLAELRKEHEALADKISQARLNFHAKAGESGKLYGSVTTNDIVDALNMQLGTSIDRRSIVGEPLRQLGDHQVTVRLSRDYQPQINVSIHPEGELEADVAAEDEAVVEAVEEANVEAEVVEAEVVEAELVEAEDVEAEDVEEEVVEAEVVDEETAETEEAEEAEEAEAADAPEGEDA